MWNKIITLNSSLFLGLVYPQKYKAVGVWGNAEWCQYCPFLRVRSAVAEQGKERNKPEDDSLYSFFWVISRDLCRRSGAFCGHDKIQTPRESPPKEIMQFSQHGKCSKSEYCRRYSGRPWSVLTRFRSDGPEGTILNCITIHTSS